MQITFIINAVLDKIGLKKKKKPKRQGYRWGVPVSVDNGVLQVWSLVFYVDPAWMPKSSAAASICSHGHQYPQANTRLAYLASTPSFFSLRALDGTINSRIPLRKWKFLSSTGRERQENKVQEERLGEKKVPKWYLFIVWICSIIPNTQCN